MSPGWARSELYAGGLHVATYINNSTYFDHSDWEGTVRALTDPTGTQVETCTSVAFGDGQSCTGSNWSPLHYTGQEMDSESNLNHMQFRQYSSTQGRWMTPDPAGMAAADPTNPQSWNRYAYVMNNPVSYADPLGLGPPEVDCSGIPQGQVNADSGLAASCTIYTPSITVYGGPAPLVPDAGWQNNGYGAGWSVTATYNIPISSGSRGGSGSSGVGLAAANDDSWGRTFTKSFFSGFSLKSARLPGESFSQCVSRVRGAGGAVTRAADAVSGVGTATYLSTASFGRTTYSVWAGVPPAEWTVSARNLSLAEGLATSAAGNGFISPGTAALVSKVAAPLSKATGLATAVAVGLEGGVLGACR